VAHAEKLAARRRGCLGLYLCGPFTTHIRALFTFAVEIMGDFPTTQPRAKAARPKVNRSPRPISGPRFPVEEVERLVKLVNDKAAAYRLFP